MSDYVSSDKGGCFLLTWWTLFAKKYISVLVLDNTSWEVGYCRVKALSMCSLCSVVPKTILDTIRYINHNASTQILFNQRMTEETQTPTGIRQGDFLRKQLYSPIMNEIINHLKNIEGGIFNHNVRNQNCLLCRRRCNYGRERRPLTTTTPQKQKTSSPPKNQ